MSGSFHNPARQINNFTHVLTPKLKQKRRVKPHKCVEDTPLHPTPLLSSSLLHKPVIKYSDFLFSPIDPGIISHSEIETGIEMSRDKKPWNAAGFMWQHLRADFTTLDRIKFPLPRGGIEAEKICVCSLFYGL